jgi:hypothetical protein
VYSFSVIDVNILSYKIGQTYKILI